MVALPSFDLAVATSGARRAMRGASGPSARCGGPSGRFIASCTSCVDEASERSEREEDKRGG